jgi:hypothetical protein
MISTYSAAQRTIIKLARTERRTNHIHTRDKKKDNNNNNNNNNNGKKGEAPVLNLVSTTP